MNLWWIMLAGGLLTFGTRLSFILLLDRLTPPAWLRDPTATGFGLLAFLF